MYSEYKELICSVPDHISWLVGLFIRAEGEVNPKTTKTSQCGCKFQNSQKKHSNKFYLFNQFYAEISNHNIGKKNREQERKKSFHFSLTFLSKLHQIYLVFEHESYTKVLVSCSQDYFFKDLLIKDYSNILMTFQHLLEIALKVTKEYLNKKTGETRLELKLLHMKLDDA